MKKVVLFSFLLLLGLVTSQFFVFLDGEMRKWIELVVKNLSLILLAFIMIHVGIEFSIDRTQLRRYGWDYFVAFTAATLPWIFCAFYFVYFFDHPPLVSKFNLWIDSLLLARFAAPTSAGVLFTMMAAAGLETTWMFKKARILAIFDDLDTIILLIPIKMLIIGFRWESIGLIFFVFILIYLSWKKMHSIKWPITWFWVLIYSVIIVAICESTFYVTKYFERMTSLQIEVLLPAFVLGCVLAYPIKKTKIHNFFESSSEKTVKFLIGAFFLFLVGLSMPAIEIKQSATVYISSVQLNFWDYKIGLLSMSAVLWHVLALTFLSNLGKMFPLFCYQKEASLKERFALALGMCPRGEVGAGVIILALGLVAHLDQALMMIATLSLALNLILTGPLIIVIKKLLSPKPVNRFHE